MLFISAQTFPKNYKKNPLITALKIALSGSLKWKTVHFSRSLGALVISECLSSTGRLALQ